MPDTVTDYIRWSPYYRSILSKHKLDVKTLQCLRLGVLFKICNLQKWLLLQVHTHLNLVICSKVSARTFSVIFSAGRLQLGRSHRSCHYSPGGAYLLSGKRGVATKFCEIATSLSSLADFCKLLGFDSCMGLREEEEEMCGLIPTCKHSRRSDWTRK